MDKEFPPIVEVDSLGNVIGPLDYLIAHRNNSNLKGIRHFSSNTFVFKDTTYKKLLLTKRSSSIRGGSLWNITIGGHGVWLALEGRAQTPLECAKEEIVEELFNLKSTPKIKFDPIASSKKDLRPNDPEYAYIYRTVLSGPFSPNPQEVSKVLFRDIDLVRDDIKKSPERYVKSAKFYLDLYLKSI